MFSSSATSLSSCSNLLLSISFILPQWLPLFDFRFFSLFCRVCYNICFVFCNFLSSGLCVFGNIDFPGRTSSWLLFLKVWKYTKRDMRGLVYFLGEHFGLIFVKNISSNVLQDVIFSFTKTHFNSSLNLTGLELGLWLGLR